MSTLTWTRGKVETTYHMGGAPRTVKHTTHSTTLTSGDRITLTSVEGSFFLDLNGVRDLGLPYGSLRDAKAAVQRREHVQVTRSNAAR